VIIVALTLARIGLSIIKNEPAYPSNINDLAVLNKHMDALEFPMWMYYNQFDSPDNIYLDKALADKFQQNWNTLGENKETSVMLIQLNIDNDVDRNSSFKYKLDPLKPLKA